MGQNPMLAMGDAKTEDERDDYVWNIKLTKEWLKYLA